MNKFIPQRRNANKHTLHGTRLLEKSITSDGWIGAMTSAADKEIFDGSDRIGVMEDKFVNEKGETVEPIIVESDGTRPVIVIRKDIPSADDPKAKRLSIAANQVPHTNYDMDGDLLKEWGNEDAAIKAMFAESEWDKFSIIQFVGGDFKTQPGAGMEGAPSSQIKMVQLFFTVETVVSFNEMCLSLSKIYGTKNITDTVTKGIQNEYDNNQ